MKKIFLLFLVSCLGLGFQAAAKGYKITVKLVGSTDTSLLLAHYYANKQYIDDTAFQE